MSAHRYWRVKCYSVGGHPTSSWNVARMEMAESANGVDVCTGGTPSSSTDYDGSHTAAKAFDKDSSTFWSASAFAYGDYLQYDFGSGVTKDIVEVRTKDRTDSNVGYNMTLGELFYSDDGSSWTSAGDLAGPVTTANGQEVTYSLNPVDSTAYRYWKITCTGNTTGNFGISELELATSVGGSNEIGSGTITGSGDDGVDHIANAVDGNISTCYGAAGGMPRYVQYDFGSGVTKNIVEVRMKSRNDGYYYQNLMQGYIEGSNDGSAWTKVAFLANTVSVSNGETKTFKVVPITVNPAAYTGPGHPYHRYWRVNADATGTGDFGFAEMTVAQSIGGSDIASSASKAADGDNGSNHLAGGFDGNLATAYGCAAGLTVNGRHVDFDFSYLFPRIEEVKITSRDGGDYAQNITSGRVRYSDDGTTWTDYWTMTAAAATSNNQVITFSNSAAGGRRRQPICVC